jgi:hypothetical protein
LPILVSAGIAEILGPAKISADISAETTFGRSLVRVHTKRHTRVYDDMQRLGHVRRGWKALSHNFAEWILPSENE